MPKLGHVLVRRGWASPEAVERALNAQTATGWRLGTCLLDNRALSEEVLLRALSEQYGVPAAGPEELRDIPREVVGSLPRRLAERCGAVPFRALSTRVYVAMIDPAELGCLDELAFALGKRVEPHVANEIRVLEALERYYDARLPGRLASLLERLDRERVARAPAADAEMEGEVPATASASVVPGRPEGAPTGEPPGELPPGSPAGPRTEERPSSVELSETDRAAMALLEAEPELGAPHRPARARDASGNAASGPGVPDAAAGDEDTRPVPAGAPPPALSLERARDRLSGCRNADEVGDLLLAALGPMFQRVALFKVLRDRVEGWKGTGSSLDTDCLRSFSTSLSRPSVFLNLRLSGSFHLGALAPMAPHRSLARCWGGGLPDECLVLPVRVRERLVTAIYLDRAPEPLGKLDLEGLLHLAAAAEDAYERCILRERRD